MELQEQADNYHGPVDRASEPKPEPGNESHHENAGDSGQTKPDADEEVIKSGTDVYKEYIGKRIFHKGYKAYGTVTSCNGKYIKVRFENGKDRGRDLAGLEKAFSLEVLLDKKLLQLV
jgi:hypothetical protein